ncbi:MAG: hypothetical protein P4L31_02655, partial [Candidatus Babeliales bacterium]|nr:hypothetical protein [Candidatus Babeliales bacterium]
MKKRILLLLLLLGAGPAQLVADSCSNSCASSCAPSCASSCSDSDDCSGCPCSGKTFFVARPMYQSYRPELWSEFRNDRMTDAQDGMGSAVEAVAFGSKSTKDRDLAQYFLPNCKNELSVKEVAAIIAGADMKSQTRSIDPQFFNADLMAENFNIVTNNGDFASDVSFSANQSVVGLGLHYKQGFYFNDDFTSWWYIDTSSSLQRVKNEMNICEVITNDGGGANTTANPEAVDSMTAAFKQSSWCYGRIDNCKSLSRTGVADIEFKVGKQYMWKKDCHLASYLGILIPTGNVPKAKHVFEAIVGHGGHWGISSGGEGGIELWSSCHENWHLNLEMAIHGQYLFNKKQVRSFDLKGKPWSRYQEVYANEAQA